MNGEPMDNEELALFAIHVLNRLKCLRLHKDTASVSLKDITKELNDPYQLTINIFKAFNSLEPKPDFFPSPYEIPTPEMFEKIVKIIHTNEGINLNYFTITLLGLQQ